MSRIWDAISERLQGGGPVEVGIGGAVLAPLHCRLLTNWAVSRPGEGRPATSLTIFTAFNLGGPRRMHWVATSADDILPNQRDQKR